MNRWHYVGLGMGCWISLAIVTHFVAWRPLVGDVDLYYFLCYARDMLQGVEPISDNRYSYFPGVYVFWAAVLAVSDNWLAAIQWVVLATLVANAVLVGLLLQRVLGRNWLAWFASLWYLVAATRFQGMTGVVEPLATLPLLTGCLVWGGRPLDRENMTRIMLLAIGIGLTVFTKQQAGLLSLGAVWLILDRGLVDVRRIGAARVQWWSVLGTLPLMSFAVLLIAVGCFADGLKPLTMGLSTVSSYATRDNPLKNFYAQWVADPVTTSAFAAAMFLLLSAFVNRRETLDNQAARLGGFLLVGSAFSCIQFFTRPYHHYFLLALPGVVVGFCLLLDQRWRPPKTAGLPWAWGVFFTAAFFPFTSAEQAVNVVRVMGPAQENLQPLAFQDAEVTKELELVKSHLTPDDPLLVLPPGQNYAHFVLGTHSSSPLGYSFRLIPPDELIWEDHNQVLILTSGWEKAHLPTPVLIAPGDYITTMKKHGFRMTESWTRMALFVRQVNPEDAK